VLSETGGFGLLLWLAGVALGGASGDEAARENARPAMWALAAMVFPFNTCEDRMRSVSVVPERGMPITKIGLALS
jgi:hypothetical protein